jgi:hypothetical protein
MVQHKERRFTKRALYRHLLTECHEARVRILTAIYTADMEWQAARKRRPA